MNGHDVTGGSDFKFSEPVRLSAVDAVGSKDITDKLKGAGFGAAEPPSNAIMVKEIDRNTTLVLIQGDPNIAGSYTARVRSASSILPDYAAGLVGALEGILEPYYG